MIPYSSLASLSMAAISGCRRGSPPAQSDLEDAPVGLAGKLFEGKPEVVERHRFATGVTRPVAVPATVGAVVGDGDVRQFRPGRHAGIEAGVGAPPESGPRFRYTDKVVSAKVFSDHLSSSTK
jgi:hypothetical protein